ncbi:hypothetical protein KZ813_12900 [Sphingomonas sp. RHCKR7]|uniref:hypothetical protein n=1 Tax=Sphingomonas folli TaxID=2862497 RepID=UPI001CA4878F|nr:hypothetical protein [Sphingomonas folli]MBW6527741.1 hypothetical protein [Sphingomonas folli]
MAEMAVQRTIILPKAVAVVGVASIDQDGAFDVEFWFTDRAAKSVETPRGAKGRQAGAVAQTPAEAERARYGLSKDAKQVMMLVRRDMIPAELMQYAAAGSPLALDFLLYIQARTILTAMPGYSTTVHYAGEGQEIDDLPHDEHVEGRQARRGAARTPRVARRQRHGRRGGMGHRPASDPWLRAVPPVAQSRAQANTR